MKTTSLSDPNETEIFLFTYLVLILNYLVLILFSLPEFTVETFNEKVC